MKVKTRKNKLRIVPTIKIKRVNEQSFIIYSLLNAIIERVQQISDAQTNKCFYLIPLKSKIIIKIKEQGGFLNSSLRQATNRKGD